MSSRAARLVDIALALLLGVAYVALLLATVKDLGYARDEGFYFQAARSYGAWFEILLSDPARALERATVDRHWAANSEHPPLMKSLFALSHRYLWERWKLMPDAGTAFRFPGMVMGGLALSLVYVWARRELSRSSALVGALLLGFQPQIFYHSHLDCFDVPVSTMWLATSYAYARSLQRGGLRWALVSGLAYGLFLATKHNAWIFPFAVVAHAVLTRGPALWRGALRGRALVPSALFAMATLGPLTLYALWPWLWSDTAQRLAGWVGFHTKHDYYNMEFLGRTYWKPPMPRAYAWVMTAATVPTITLVLFLVGFVASARHLLGSEVGRRIPRLSWLATPRDPRRASTDLLWALSIAASYAPWLGSNTPIFGGTKHWITAYPFMCLFAARGFELAAARLAALLGGRVVAARLGFAATTLVAPVTVTLHSHPWGLSSYTALVGGVPGAASLGLNRGFWGYQTGALAPFMNATLPPGAAVYVHDTALQSWSQLQADGRVRRDLRGTLAIVGSEAALYHHEQHMARVEQQTWIVYGTVSPATLGIYDGVPIVWLYRKP